MERSRYGADRGCHRNGLGYGIRRNQADKLKDCMDAGWGYCAHLGLDVRKPDARVSPSPAGAGGKEQGSTGTSCRFATVRQTIFSIHKLGRPEQSSKHRFQCLRQQMRRSVRWFVLPTTCGSCLHTSFSTSKNDRLKMK